MLCTQETRELIGNRLSEFPVIEKNAEKVAAVALVVVEGGYGPDLAGFSVHADWQTHASLVLTRRAAHLTHHAGQWALPGGRVDAGETLLQTAVRETREEICFDISETDYLGRLDDYVSRSGFVMSALVFWGGAATDMKPSPDEVESIHRIPFDELLREDAPILNYDELEAEDRLSDVNHPVLRMPIADQWIAAPTAALLYQFREVCLLGKHTRVAHFEQPRFAWK